ncbi:uncharacterized protein LOC123886812 [Trifolium pratense]|uniref:uncharacterized protein LOC123886812 n=1 Tax=Trifolium pratense TaxID=57577 RepID=UPI001E6942B6|nr:uncharacterized protein LOC123886812 [Trifolium pratense]
MRDYETIQEFHMTILDYDNQFDALGEKISEEKLVRKMLRSLPKKFDIKVTAIEEAKDISEMKLDELVGSLQTYEVATNERTKKKNKNIAFVSNADDEEVQSDMETDESILDAIVRLGREFNKVLKMMDKNSRPNKGKGVQCHDCEGYGHVKAECPTFLKNKKGGMSPTYSDKNSEKECDDNTTKRVMAFTGKYDSDNESCDGEVTYEELADSYRELYFKIDSQLEEILEKNVRKPKHIGLSYENVNKHRGYNSDLMYTHPKETQSTRMLRKTLQHPKQHHETRYKGKRRSWICHHCGRKGHIRPFCYKLYGYPNINSQPKPAPMTIPTQKEWKPKSMDMKTSDVILPENKVASLIAHTSFRASSRENWYFDSGCSRHMTGISKFLVDLKSYPTTFATFGDGAKGEIVGIGKLSNNRLPKLDNVLLVKGLTANLISISQLCDQGMKVKFTKSECLVTNDKGDLLMKGVRSKDNCYLWVPQEEANVSTCLITKSMMKSINVVIDDTLEGIVLDAADAATASLPHDDAPEIVEECIVTLENIATEEKFADIFTKALDAVQFKKLRGKLVICLFEEL